MRAEAEPSTAKSELYFQGVNRALLSAIPSDARLVLDVGCAAGLLGREIKAKRPGVVVHGIDRASEALGAARRNLDRVFVADLEEKLPQLGGPYDCLVFGDVLEHLVDPWTALRSLVAQLQPTGYVVASIPNLRHYKLLRDLVIRGRFTYRESGILDSTHLRFFTRREMERLFDSAGLEVVSCQPQYRGGNWLLRFADAASFGGLHEFRAFQFVLVGRRRTEAGGA